MPPKYTSILDNGHRHNVINISDLIFFVYSIVFPPFAWAFAIFYKTDKPALHWWRFAMWVVITLQFIALLLIIEYEVIPKINEILDDFMPE